MGDIDPETEALMRKLHRELNGLTRSTRPRGQAGAARTTRAEAPAPPSDSETSASSSGSEEDDEEGEDDGGEGEEEEGEEVKRVAERGEARPIGGQEQERRLHGVATTAPARAAAGSGGARGDIAAAGAARGAKRARNDLGGESRPHGRPPKQVSPGSHAAAADIPPVADPFKTPLEAAAAAAAYEVRSKARRVASISAGTSAQLDARARAASHTPMIKCFHAGVRWGITLPRDSIKSRAELATQLNNAFAGEILSCGRGDILTILFLDADGHTTEFQALRGAGTHDSRQWGASVERALRVYVRRG